MSKKINMVDAKEPITIHIKQCHIDGAKRRDPKNCMLARALKQEFEIDEAAVHRNVVWIKFKGDSHITRYQSSPATRTAVAAFDKTLQKAISLGMVQLPKDGMQAILRVPRKAISIAKLRSKKMKDIRNASAKRRAGSKKRAYKLPDSLTLEGVRASQGYRI